MTRLRAQEWSEEIEPFSPLPLHHQMAEILVSHLSRDRISVGDMLPPEEELADHFQISRNTVRRAYAELEADGWIERKAGRGTTLVRKPLGAMPSYLINPERGISQILELCNDSVVRQHLKPDSAVPPEVAAFLDTQELTTIEEEGFVGGRRVGMCTWWIPTKTLRESDVSIIDITSALDGSSPSEEDEVAFTDSLRRRLTLVVSRRASRQQAKTFELAAREPLLVVHFQLENADSTSPIAYAIAIWRADEIGFRLGSNAGLARQ
jgi:GntR family transcriptional regulator, phosphonate transport system regulatory protein